jgi:hypothetical protein
MYIIGDAKCKKNTTAGTVSADFMGELGLVNPLAGLYERMCA